MEEIKKLLNDMIDAYDKELDEEEASSFYDLGIGSDGVPNSYGNFDDCYSDGFDIGEKSGEYWLAQKILSILGE